MHERASDETRLKQALKWLSTVRQATVDLETAAAYRVGLQDLPIRVVEQACKDIGYAARAEYETAWPELGVIRARCLAILRVEREREESRRLLSAPPTDPITPEQWEDIKQRFRDVLKSKKMPAGRAPGGDRPA